MGYSVSYLAIKGMAPQAVRNELGFRATGVHEGFAESKLSAAELPGGWYLIGADHEEQVVPDSVIQRLSASGCEVVTCFAEEHVMFCSANGWRDGRKLWSITHNAQDTPNHLVAEGDLPAKFSQIRDRLFSEQREYDLRKPRKHQPLFQKRGDPPGSAGCDLIFDIPVATVESLTGFRYDRSTPGLGDAAFEVLVPTLSKPEAVVPKAKPSFLRRLFGAEQ